MGPLFLRGGGSLALRGQQYGLVHRLQRTISPGSEVQEVENVSTWIPQHIPHENQPLVNRRSLFCRCQIELEW